MKEIKLHYCDGGRPKKLIASKVETLSDIKEHIMENRLRGRYSLDYYLHDAGKYENAWEKFVTNWEIYELL